MISKIKIGNTEYDIWPVKGIDDGHIPSSYVSCWVGNDLPVTYKDF